MTYFNKILVANRSEIAIRVFRAATELGIRTVAIHAHEDRFALHRFKADEAYVVGLGLDPIKAYLNIDEILQIARDTGVDAIHPGYGFLSESPEFADACKANSITFIGPASKTLRMLGDKVAARSLAIKAGVATIPASDIIKDNDKAKALAAAEKIGFPLMIKAVWGGGGRGMRRVYKKETLLSNLQEASEEAKSAFGKGDVYLESLIENARHIEVQIVGDKAGNKVHLFERDCTVQRRNQKVVEVAPAACLSSDMRGALCDAALKIANFSNYENAGTMEFLLDIDRKAFYFIEVNPRIQVEHTVTEEVTGIDLVSAQIKIAAGALIGKESGVPLQQDIRSNGFAIQARVTTEDSEADFAPDYGRILAYRGATGFGIRLDGGTAFSGALITPHYDSLLEKVTAWAPTRDAAISRLNRALKEFRIRGVKTNLRFLESLIDHPKFRADDINTRYIDDTDELFDLPKRRDRATRLLSFIAEVLVNNNPDLAGRTKSERHDLAALPQVTDTNPKEQGTREILKQGGVDALLKHMQSTKKLWVSDTTFRDAHQSLLATRMRTIDLVAPMPAYQTSMRGLFSLEVWGGATFDVAMRFLREDPWKRLADMREASPSILFQMLLRGANAVGYTSYPDNVIRFFIKQAFDAGIDVFRVFDSLNWVENMRVAMDAVKDTGGVVEAALCYTGDILDPKRPKYDLKYYVKMARELKKAGADILAIKDMAGLLKPDAARVLIKAIKEETNLPIHLHTHDTSGGQIATLLAASQEGVDIVDVAMDPLSGLTSQPCMGTLVTLLERDQRATKLDHNNIDSIAHYWSLAREHYQAFESDMRAGTSDIYLHEMPGGQYTNLREQTRALGMAKSWPLVIKRYAEVNQMFGDIVKVTPSSKVVGDMALFMVSHDLTPQDCLDEKRQLSFPESVISLFRGDLGQPEGGFPKKLQKRILGDIKPTTKRPGSLLEDADLDAIRKQLSASLDNAKVDDRDLASYLMYPDVFVKFAADRDLYGDLSKLSTPVCFHGPKIGEELSIDLAQGKRLILRLLAISRPDTKGQRTVFFELNGQPRNISVIDEAVAVPENKRARAQIGNPAQIGASMPGTVVKIETQVGADVAQGDPLLVLESMKIKTSINSPINGKVKDIAITVGEAVDSNDLLITLEPSEDSPV